jgi:Rieske Fe-S protein
VWGEYTVTMNSISRREALGTITAVSASVAFTGCMPVNSNPGASLAPSGARVGALSDFPQVGSYKELELAGTPALVTRTATESKGGVSSGDVHLIALSRVCTHLGCLVNAPKTNVLVCACHNSLFDASTGAVKQGPAGTPLATFKLEIRSDGVFAVP